MADVVFVQPHFDDIALSCGGTVAALAGSGRVAIVTIFGGEPQQSASDFARFQHERWKLTESGAVQARRNEDLAAARALGEAIDVIWFDYPDAIYRDALYSSDEALFGRMVDTDDGLAERIAADLEELGSRFVMPLGVGNHVDHQLAFSAGRILARQGNEVWLYPDLPYSLDESAFHRRLDEVGRPQPCVCELTSNQFERRWRAIECYVSQLPVLFRDLPDARQRFQRFGDAYSDRLPVELFWAMRDIEGRQQ